MKESVEMADRQIQYQKMPEGNRCFHLSVNTPEETNDEPTTYFSVGFLNSRPLNNLDLLPPLIKTVPHETDSEQMLQIPCESDESSNFSSDHTGNACGQSINNDHPHFENISLLKPLTDDAEYTSDFIAKNMDSDRNMEPQETMASSREIVPSHRENGNATCSSQGKFYVYFEEWS